LTKIENLSNPSCGHPAFSSDARFVFPAFLHTSIRPGKKMRRQGEELDAAIEKLYRKMEKAPANEKAGLQQRRDRLALERDELSIDLRRVGEDMKDGWNDFKNDVTRRMEKTATDLKADQ
jgi:hypothetical protein